MAKTESLEMDAKVVAALPNTMFRLEVDMGGKISIKGKRAREALLLEGAPADRIRVQFPGVNTEHFRPVGRDAAGVQYQAIFN